MSDLKNIAGRIIGVEECVFHSHTQKCFLLPQSNPHSREGRVLTRKSGVVAGFLTQFFFEKVVAVAIAASVKKFLTSGSFRVVVPPRDIGSTKAPFLWKGAYPPNDILLA